MTYPMKRFACLILILLVFSTCKKENNQYNLLGIVIAANTGATLDGVSITLQKQVVETGVYNNNFQTAAHTTSTANGQFELNWARENFAALRLDCEKSQYIKSEMDLIVNDFSTGKTETTYIILQPEAFVSVHIQNSSPSDITDQFRFTFANANFDCICCSNGWKTFAGELIDTTFTCRLYGETWLRFQKDYYTAQNDTMLIDSVFCPAFQTTNLEIEY